MICFATPKVTHWSNSLLKLPITFTHEELESIVTWCENNKEFSPVITKYNKNRQWTAISLRGYSKDIYQIGKGGVLGTDQIDELQDTPLLEELKVHKILEKIPAATERVRLMKLKAGTKISKHTDKVDKDIKSGRIVRLHIPIVTDEDVTMITWLETKVPTEFKMTKGNCYWLDVAKPHAVINDSSLDRIHLVVDVYNNEFFALK